MSELLISYVRCRDTLTGRIKVQGHDDTLRDGHRHILSKNTLGMNYFTFTRDTSFTPNLRVCDE